MQRFGFSLFACMALSLTASAFSGKTLYHYVAYHAAFWPKALPATVENYPKVALSGIDALTFDTLVFAPTFGFGSMAAKLNSADFPTGPRSRPRTPTR